MAIEGDHPSITITVVMKTKRIDLNVTNPVAVDELAASLKRAGITQLSCNESRGKQSETGFEETLEFTAILQDG